MPSYHKRVEIPGQNASELYARVEKDMEKFLVTSTAGLIGKLDVKKDPASHSIQVDSKLFNARLLCEDGAIDLQGKIGLMALPFRSKIDEVIDRWIAKHFQTTEKKSS